MKLEQSVILQTESRGSQPVSWYLGEQDWRHQGKTHLYIYVVYIYIHIRKNMNICLRDGLHSAFCLELLERLLFCWKYCSCDCSAKGHVPHLCVFLFRRCEPVTQRAIGGRTTYLFQGEKKHRFHTFETWQDNEEQLRVLGSLVGTPEAQPDIACNSIASGETCNDMFDEESVLRSMFVTVCQSRSKSSCCCIGC